MPEISKIQLPSGSIYDIKDAVARQTLSGAIIIRGVTTTALTDESTTNPITIDGNSYTAVANDAVFYQKKEFLFDGTKWHELGDISGTVTGVKGNSESTYRTGQVNLTAANIGAAASSHTHGNITSGGDITATAPTIASGDQIIINDDSASKITNGPTFDGSTTTKALTPKGTWETFLQSHQTIKQDGVTGATVNRYASCSTAAGTAAKTASITTGTFSLEAGSIVNVKFANTNTASTPTLNINGTGAKNIFSNGAQISTGTNKGLLKGLCTFIYDGTQYHLVGGYIDTQYSLPIADYDTLGGVKPFISRTSSVVGPTPATASGTVIVRGNTDAPHNYFPVETDVNGRMFVNAPVPQVFSVDQAQNQAALESGLQDAAYTNGIVNLDGGLAATAFFGKVNVSVDITISSVVIKLGNYNCFIETIPLGTGYLHGSLTMSKVPVNTTSATIDDLEIYHAVFVISMSDPFRAPEFKWTRTGALAWKSSGTYDKTTGGSASVSLKIPTSKTVALSVTTATPASQTATGEVGYIASISNETLTLNKIICTTGASITVPSSATAYTGTITPTHTSTNVTFS